MSHKIIPYPCDYENTASVRRARRGGNIFVIILCCIIVLLLGTGAFFALSNGRKALDIICRLGDSIRFTENGLTFSRISESPETAAPSAQNVQPEQSGEPQPEQSTDRLPEGETTPRSAADGDALGFNVIPDVVDSVTPGVIGVLNYQKVLG